MNDLEKSTKKSSKSSKIKKNNEDLGIKKINLNKFKDIIQSILKTIHYYKQLEIINVNSYNICIQTCEILYEEVTNLLNDNSDTNYNKKCQAVKNELTELIKKFGCSNVDDLLYISFNNKIPTNNNKYNILKNYYHPINCKIINWDSVLFNDQYNSFSINKNKSIDDKLLISKAASFDCFDMSRTSSDFYCRINGLILVIHNYEEKKTLIINGIMDNILLNCFENDYISAKLKSLFIDVTYSEHDKKGVYYKNMINMLSLKELLIYNKEDINTKYNNYLNNVNLIKLKQTDEIINDFINNDLFNQRLTIIQLLLQSEKIEYQYLVYLLYDLLSSESNGQIDSRDQKMIFDSLPWNIKKYFKDAMKETIEYTNELNKFDNSKIPLEQQICLLKVNDSVKEKAMTKLKEVKSKSEDSGSKARQWLEGLLKIPFGTFREEEILKMKYNIFADYENIKTNHFKEMSIMDINLDNNNCIDIINNSRNIIKYCKKEKESIFYNKIHNKLLNPKNKRTDIIYNITYINKFIKTHDISFNKITHSGKNITYLNNKIQEFYNCIKENEDKIKIFQSQFIEVNNTFAIEKIANTILGKYNTISKNLNMVDYTLNESVHGHDTAKKQIKRIIGQWINGDQSGYAFGFEGPPGVGKTSLAKKGIANCLKDANGTSRPFAFIAIGGSSNASTLDGHNYTYVGSTWGRIVDILIEKKCMNPIIFIDELDKISKTEHGKELIGILTHLIDTTQNDAFHDKYFNGIDLDLSKALFIFSYNDVDAIDNILLDRIHRIKFDYLTLNDKLEIANSFLLPEIYKKMGLENTINISNDVLKYIIKNYTREPGVRKFKELLFEIIGEINLNILQNVCSDIKLPIVITVEDIKFKYLKDRHEIIKKEISSENKIGLINGLWANAYGMGGVIPIQCSHYLSNTYMELKLTGMQGDVMKESMNVARTLACNLTDNETIKSNNERYKENLMQGIHIHCPEGATPKDGPSAGTAITSCIYSLLNNKKIRREVAITGEITLQGNVTAIGGLDLKILGGMNAGVTTFLFPKENNKDFIEFKEKYKDLDLTEISFIQVDHISQVFEIIFVE